MTSVHTAHTLRPAETRDLPALGRLGGSLVRLHHGFDRLRFMAPRGDIDEGYGWFLGTQLGEKDVVVLVAEVDERVIGYVYAGLEPMSWKELREPAGFVHDVVVEESVRGRGIATALVEAAARWLIEHGAPRVMLWTASENPAAQRLFKRLGFRTTMLEMTREAS
ncbi:MAG TPA: GNAT family N-acetyltransferase [Polyangia bacterium]|nr:GNAT family N-acetyltransferase [Polyangia bacterium]